VFALAAIVSPESGAPLIGNRSEGTLLTIEELFCAHRQSESITI